MALIEALFGQSVEILPFLRMGDGEPLYGPAETRRCRLQRGQKLMHTYKGEDGTIDQILANAKMFCCGTPIPDRSVVRYGEQSYIVLRCEVKNGFSDHHLEVYLE